MRVKLRKTAAGRYAIGVDVELGLDGPKPRPQKPGGTGPGSQRERPGEDMTSDEAVLEQGTEDEEDEAFASGAGDEPDTFAADEGDDGALSAAEQDHDDQDERAFDAGDGGDGDSDAGFAAGDDDGEQAFADEGEHDGMSAAEDDGEDDGEDDAQDGAAFTDEGEHDGMFAAEDDGDDAEDGEDGEAFADDDDDESVAARWPNRLPVRKGVAAISQAPAIFDEPGDDEDDADVDADDNAPAAGRARARPMAATAARSRPAPPKPAPGRPAPARPAPAAGAARRMLAAARKTIGMAERPPGSNHNKITEWYNKNIAKIGNGPWCNMAVTYWAGHSKNLPAIFAGRGIGYAYTVAHAQKFKQKGRWRAGTAGIKPGDVVFFDWRGSRSIQNIDHVGVVERVKGKNIVTIEGNTTGDSCRRMVRDARYIVGYGRPVYK